MGDAIYDDGATYAAQERAAWEEAKRLDRYAEAIAKAVWPRVPDVGRWAWEWYPEAHAAIAVADAEQAAMLPTTRNAIDRYAKENARLRAELEEAKESARNAYEVHADSVELNNRLRAELADTKRRAVDDIFAKNDEIASLRATIERVRRALLMAPADRLADEIRAALEGEA